MFSSVFCRDLPWGKLDPYPICYNLFNPDHLPRNSTREPVKSAAREDESAAGVGLGLAAFNYALGTVVAVSIQPTYPRERRLSSWLRSRASRSSSRHRLPPRPTSSSRTASARTHAIRTCLALIFIQPNNNETCVTEVCDKSVSSHWQVHIMELDSLLAWDDAVSEINQLGSCCYCWFT